MPESTLRWRNFNEKKPYLMFSVFALVLVGFAVGFLFEQLAQSKVSAVNDVQPKLDAENAKVNKINTVWQRKKDVEGNALQLTTWMEDRYYWGDVLADTRLALIRAENDVQKKLSTEKPGVQAGIWIQQMTTMGGATLPEQQPQGAAGSLGTTQTTNTITLLCRAVSLQNVDPSANSDIAYAVQNELQACKSFDLKTTTLQGNISPDGPDGTFTFGVNVTLATPPQF